MSKYTAKYPSRYASLQVKLVTAPQYIIELICEHRAKFLKTELPIKFWNQPEWAAFFKRNLRQVYKALKSYDPDAIIAALNDPEGLYKWALNTKKFIALMNKHQAIINRRKESVASQPAPDIDRTHDTNTRPQKLKPAIQQLLDLDNA